MKTSNVISLTDYRNRQTANTLERQLEQIKARKHTELAYSAELKSLSLHKLISTSEEPASGLAAVGKLPGNPQDGII
ncbi:hypothetical protein ACO0LO_24870 [Undibacterium sp. TJN25]|uniref:hypothetical protein n=1 Tax=Undibacterium sp. TJN25 TaxID=3413056 RepID=UPI003BF3702A